MLHQTADEIAMSHDAWQQVIALLTEKTHSKDLHWVFRPNRYYLDFGIRDAFQAMITGFQFVVLLSTQTLMIRYQYQHQPKGAWSNKPPIIYMGDLIAAIRAQQPTPLTIEPDDLIAALRNIRS